MAGTHTIYYVATLTHATRTSETYSRSDYFRVTIVDSCTLTEPSVKPTVAERTHEVLTQSTMNLGVWSLVPSGYNAEYTIAYTITDSSNNALPSFISWQTDSSNIVFTFNSNDVSDAATITVKVLATATRSSDQSTKTDYYTFYLYMNNPCINGNSYITDAT